MVAWWAELNGVTQGFFISAGVFSLLMIWQMIAALVGLAGDSDMDVDGGGDADFDAHGMDHPEFEHGAEVDGIATVASFKLLSIRSILAFLTMFTWAGALYTQRGDSVAKALGVSTIWGVGAMIVVAAVLWWLKRLAESGNVRIATCVGTEGTVYLDIPAAGVGEAKVTVSGVISHVKARGEGGVEIKSGTPVRVTRVIGPRTVEVKPN